MSTASKDDAIDWVLTGVLYVVFGLVWVLDALSWMKARVTQST